MVYANKSTLSWCTLFKACHNYKFSLLHNDVVQESNTFLFTFWSIILVLPLFLLMEYISIYGK